MTSTEKFWVDEPCVLVTDLRPFPLPGMSRDEKLNALTRLSAIISLVLYFMDYEYWFTFLILSILAILLLKYAGCKDSYGGNDAEGSDAGNSDETIKEDFTLVPTYSNPDYHTTTVAPIFAEEWQIPPPLYDIYTNTPPPMTFQEPLKQQQYPYGQYLTRTNLLPSDEYGTHMLNGGTKQAREYANTAFTRHSLNFREEMSRLYKKKLARRFRMNCSDTFSPYSSY
jgi:hypothetical protein